MKNGFPTWRGTGYYYSRFRPGLGTVLAGLLLVFGGGAHYGALVLSWKRQRDFVDRYIRQARRAAWGDELGIRGLGSAPAPAPVPAADTGDAGALPVNRRQKRMMDRESRKEKKNGGKSGSRSNGTSTPTGEPIEPTGERKRVVAENGKVLIVDSVGNVFLEEETEDGERQEFLLDLEEIQRPTLRDTMIFKLPGWMYQKTAGQILGTSVVADEGAVFEDEQPDAVEAEQSTSAVASGRATSRKRAKRSQRS